VEAVPQRDDGGAGYAVVIRSIFARCFDGAFVGFRAGIGEEHFLHTRALA